MFFFCIQVYSNPVRFDLLSAKNEPKRRAEHIGHSVSVHGQQQLRQHVRRGQHVHRRGAHLLPRAPEPRLPRPRLLPIQSHARCNRKSHLKKNKNRFRFYFMLTYSFFGDKKDSNFHCDTVRVYNHLLLDGQPEQRNRSVLHLLRHNHSRRANSRLFRRVLVGMCAKHEFSYRSERTGSRATNDLCRLFTQFRVSFTKNGHILL